MGGISIWQLLIILAVVLLIFGTKRLRNMGSDLGGAIKGFKKSVKDEDQSEGDEARSHISKEDADVVDGEIKSEEKTKS